jgi:hypothetical protein
MPREMKICKNKECNKVFRSRENRHVFCTEICRQKSTFFSIGNTYNLSTGQLGALSELIATTDLIKKGYEVFRAVSPSASCDLIILKNGKLHRIEVRTGYLKADGAVRYPATEKDIGKSDSYAVVFPTTNTVEYIPSLEKISNSFDDSRDRVIESEVIISK